MLQCVAVCCSELQCVATQHYKKLKMVIGLGNEKNNALFSHETFQKRPVMVVHGSAAKLGTSSFPSYFGF